ncbi:MAG: hypothetical protein M3P94_06955 [Chloroflexota bacterium]|nr:hypothetical protein [Chloroflexota bacterium]
MAEVTKTGVPSVCTAHPGAEHQITGLYAATALAAGDAVYISATTGKATLATGAAAGAAARVVGFVSKPASADEACTIHRGVHYAYGPKVAGVAVAPGTELFLSGTVPGGLADAASVGGTVVIAVVIDTDGRIIAKGNY